MTTYHKNLRGDDYHPPGYVRASDPGVVGSGILWVDKSGGAGNWVIKVRNDSDAGWESVITATIVHKDTHDPEDGADPLDTAAPSELASVQAAGEGSSHSFARADHQHQIQHSIADNHLVTVDGTVNDDEWAMWTASGLEGRTNTELVTLLRNAGLIGIDDNDILEVDGTVANNDIMQATTAGLKGLTYAELVPLIDGAADWDFADSDLANIKQVDFQDEHNASASTVINWNEGNNQYYSIDGNDELSFTAPAGPAHLQLRIIQDVTGSRVPTWSGSNLLWAGGTAPTLSTGGYDEDILSWWYNGTNYYGVGLLDFS